VGCCEHGNEPLVSVKCRELLVYLNYYELVSKDSDPWNEFMLAEWKI